MEVIPDKEEVAIDSIPLATKPPSIVGWKINKEGQTSYYQITRVDGSSNMHLVFSQLLKSFDREDLETLWRLVKAKHGYTRLEEGYERVLGGDLKVMFEPHVEDAVWRNLQGSKVLIWKLFDSWRIVGIKRLLDDLKVTAAKVYVTAAKHNTASIKLVLLVKIEENILSSYYCLYTVNAAGV
ncbi:hypothetical protein Tco_1493283 [Tanacetum coccineum]